MKTIVPIAVNTSLRSGGLKGADWQGCGVGSPVIRLRLRLQLRPDSDLQLY